MNSPSTTTPAVIPPIRGQLIGSLEEGGGGKGGVGDGSVKGCSA